MPGKKPLSIRYCSSLWGCQGQRLWQAAWPRSTDRRGNGGSRSQTTCPGSQRGVAPGHTQAQVPPSPRRSPPPAGSADAPRGLEPRRRAAGRAFACCPPVAAAGAAADRSRRGRSVGMTRGGGPPGCSAMGRCGAGAERRWILTSDRRRRSGLSLWPLAVP